MNHLVLFCHIIPLTLIILPLTLIPQLNQISSSSPLTIL